MDGADSGTACTASKVWADFAVYVTEDAIANLYITCTFKWREMGKNLVT